MSSLRKQLNKLKPTARSNLQKSASSNKKKKIGITKALYICLQSLSLASLSDTQSINNKSKLLMFCGAPILTKQLNLNEAKQETQNIIKMNPTTIYDGKLVVYYDEKINDSFASSKQQLIQLLDEIIKLNPENLRKFSDLRERIQQEFTEKTIISLNDKKAILFSLKKELEYIYLTHQDKLKEISSVDISHLELTKCWQGVYSTMISWSYQIQAANFTKMIVDIKRTVIQQLALAYITSKNQSYLIGNEVHIVNALFNLVADQYGLSAIEDHFATQHLPDDVIVEFPKFISEKLSFYLLQDEFTRRGLVPKVMNYGEYEKLRQFFEEDREDKDQYYYSWYAKIHDNTLEYPALKEQDLKRVSNFLFHQKMLQREYVSKDSISEIKSNDKQSVCLVTATDMFVEDLFTTQIRRPFESSDLKNFDLKTLLNSANGATYLQYLSQEDILDSGCRKDVIVFSLLNKKEELSEASVQYIVKCLDMDEFIGLKNMLGQSVFSLIIENDHESVFLKYVDLCMSMSTDKDSILSSEGEKLIQWAVEKDHVKVLEKLGELKADFKQADKMGKALVYMAAEKGHVEVLQVLKQFGADLNQADKNGWTPAFIAARNGNVRVLEKLGELKADFKQADEMGKTLVYIAAKKGHVEVLQILKQFGADLDQADDSGATPAFVAAWNGNVRVLEKLGELGADLNQANKSGWTPVYVAAWKGDVRVLEKLGELKADFNQEEENSWTPVHVAAWNGHVEVLQILKQFGADLNKADKHGKTPAYIVAKKRSYGKVLEKLGELGADFNQADENGMTPVHVAVLDGHVELLQILKQFGADLNKPDRRGRTPAHVAAWNGHVGILEKLGELGADFNQADENGMTPVQVHIVGQNNIGVLQILKQFAAKSS